MKLKALRELRELNVILRREENKRYDDYNKSYKRLSFTEFCHTALCVSLSLQMDSSFCVSAFPLLKLLDGIVLLIIFYLMKLHKYILILKVINSLEVICGLHLYLGR